MQPQPEMQVSVTMSGSGDPAAVAAMQQQMAAQMGMTMAATGAAMGAATMAAADSTQMSIQMTASPQMTVQTTSSPGMTVQVTGNPVVAAQMAAQMGAATAQMGAAMAGAAAAGAAAMSDAEMAAFKAANPEIAGFNPDAVVVCQVPQLQMNPAEYVVKNQLQTQSPNISQERAMEILDAHTKAACCMSHKFVKEVKISNFARADAITVYLDATFETRNLRPRHRPYSGGPISQGMSPNPWELNCQPGQWYHDEQHEIPLPGSEIVKICYRCFGRGRITCPNCHGNGRERCHACNGQGWVEHSHTVSNPDGSTRTERRRQDCPHCNGGWKTCHECGGRTHVTCPTCSGNGQLVHYQAVIVAFQNIHLDHVLDSEAQFLKGLPVEKIKSAPAIDLWKEEQPYIIPAQQLNTFRISPNISQRVDAMMVGEFAQRCNGKGLLRRERLRVTGTPIFRAEYAKGAETKIFFIYGTDYSVEAPDWPCCCYGCNVM